MDPLNNQRLLNHILYPPPSKKPVISAIQNHPTTDLTKHQIAPVSPSPVESLTSVFGSDLNAYEAAILSEVLTDTEFSSHIEDWCKRAPTEREIVRLEIQSVLNERISFSDTLKFAFYDLMKIYKESTFSEIVKKIGDYLLDLFLSPFQFIYNVFKTVIVPEDRDLFIEKIKRLARKRSITYEDRKHLAHFLMKVGISGVISLAIGSAILTGGISALPFIILGAIAAAGVTGKIANDRFAHKSASLTVGELTRDILQIAAESAPVSLATGGLLRVPITSLFVKGYNNISNITTTTELTEVSQ